MALLPEAWSRPKLGEQGLLMDYGGVQHLHGLIMHDASLLFVQQKPGGLGGG